MGSDNTAYSDGPISGTLKSRFSCAEVDELELSFDDVHVASLGPIIQDSFEIGHISRVEVNGS